MLKVVKFGGSSVASAQQFRKVKHIIESDPSRRVVVASAAGKRTPDDHKMTDLLYLVQAHLKYGVSAEDILDTLRSRLVEIRDELGLAFRIEDEFDAWAGSLNKESNVDEIVSRGEYFTSRLLAEFLGYAFADAKDCVFFGYDGRIDEQKTYEAIGRICSEKERVVIPGFYGQMPGGRVKVLSRGGSDVTGALAAAAVGADVYENWTDVSGILMADPRIVDDPRSIRQITYAELKELTLMGASVLHEDAVDPVRRAGIALNIRNTNEPGDPGTMIVEKVVDEPDDPHFITGLAGKRNFSILTLRKRDMEDSSMLIKTLQIVDRYQVKAEHIVLGVDSFALMVSSDEAGDDLYSIIADIKNECVPDKVLIQDKVSLIAAVGRRMMARPGISGKLFAALGDNQINIRTIKQGADERSIIIGVRNEDFEQAIRVLYGEFAG
ncbi:MAG: aspartate kinase [Firmicutes bacterium]|nr:aspartate kinase [Bacillota bacterium]